MLMGWVGEWGQVGVCMLVCFVCVWLGGDGPPTTDIVWVMILFHYK